jgi:hypothetical protein
MRAAIMCVTLTGVSGNFGTLYHARESRRPHTHTHTHTWARVADTHWVLMEAYRAVPVRFLFSL